MKTFAQGIYPEYFKEDTKEIKVIEATLPDKVVVPLHQHTGAPCDPVVKVGDEVYEGQKIGDSQNFVSAPVHASISGKVAKIDKAPHPCGGNILAVAIEGQLVNRPETFKPSPQVINSLTPGEIKKIVREAGMVGLGGAAFPTQVKLTPPEGKKIDTILINGCECEPYITADHRIMLERAEDVIFGAKMMAKAVKARRIIIGVEDDKKNAIFELRAVIRKQHNEWVSDGIEVIEVETKYPQGGEKQLIKVILNREVPSGGLPYEVGVVVQNVATAVAVAEAIKFGTPLIKRVITVTGSGVKERKNLLVRIGATFEEVIGQCGGLTEDAVKVIMGGPMMGIAVSSLEVPVVKATTCLLVLSRKDSKIYEEKDCIRCGRCIKSCPMGLIPNFIVSYAKLKDWDKTKEYHVLDCIECGCCAYVCPSRIFLVQYFKVAKRELQARKAV